MKRKLTLEDHGFTKTKRFKGNSKINALPTELLIKIFKFLTPDTRRNMLTVSNRWLKIMNIYFRSDHCLILNDETDYSPGGSLYTTFLNRLSTTKHFRKFSHLIIDSFPEKSEDLTNLLTFLELIGEEVKNLKIRDISSELNIKHFYSKVRNIEALEVEYDESGDFLTYLSSDTKVKNIKMLSPIFDPTALVRCREIKTIHTLTICSLELLIVLLENDDTKSFLGIDVIRALKLISGDCSEGLVSLKANFNYCSENKMSLKDVEGIWISNCATILSSNTFDHFMNLKELSFSTYSVDSFILIKKRVKYSGITKFTIEGFSKPTNFIKLLQSFPDIQQLDIAFALEDLEFKAICESMPKMRELSAHWSKISIRELLAEDKHSLKDLKFLERLSLRTNDEIVDVSDLTWPSLPHLKILTLSGQSLKPFNQSFYLQMAHKSPKITYLSIGYANYQDIYNNVTKFVPLLKHLKLTHLTLPGEFNNANVEEPNSSLVEIIVPHCKTLQVLNLQDINGFCLWQEMLLFKSLPALKTVCLVSNSRVITRKDSENIKPYLKNNLHLYKKLKETIDYIIEDIMSEEQYVNFCESFNDQFGENEDELQKDLYIVTCKFLEMTCYELCKMLEYMQRFNSPPV